MFLLVHERTSERCVAQHDEAMETMKKKKFKCHGEEICFSNVVYFLCALVVYQTWYYY